MSLEFAHLCAKTSAMKSTAEDMLYVKTLSVFQT